MFWRQKFFDSDFGAIFASRKQLNIIQIRFGAKNYTAPFHKQSRFGARILAQFSPVVNNSTLQNLYWFFVMTGKRPTAERNTESIKSSDLQPRRQPRRQQQRHLHQQPLCQRHPQLDCQHHKYNQSEFDYL